jgi:uncharacterized cupredoxin-like copper-binding protein
MLRLTNFFRPAVSAAVTNGTPGTYEFFCAVRGHKQIGMKGRLTIR